MFKNKKIYSLLLLGIILLTGCSSSIKVEENIEADTTFDYLREEGIACFTNARFEKEFVEGMEIAKILWEETLYPGLDELIGLEGANDTFQSSFDGAYVKGTYIEVIYNYTMEVDIIVVLDTSDEKIYEVKVCSNNREKDKEFIEFITNIKGFSENIDNKVKDEIIIQLEKEASMAIIDDRVYVHCFAGDESYESSTAYWQIVLYEE